GKSERIELGSGTIRGGFEVAHHPRVNGAQVMGVMSACIIHESQRIETGLGKGAAHATPGQSREGCPGPTMGRRTPAQEEVALAGDRIFDYKSVIKDPKE